LRALIFFILLVPIFSFSQTATVKLHVKEKSNKLNRGAWKYAWIYNADTSYKQYSDIDNRKAFFDSLLPDNYTISIHSKYGNKRHLNDIKIQINEKKKLVLNTKSSPFREYKDTVPLSSKIQENDTFSIQYSITQCRNTIGQTSYGWADIYKNDSNFYMRYSIVDSTNTVKLSYEQIRKLMRAEKNLLKENISFFNGDYKYAIRLNNTIYEDRHACFDIIKDILKP
jgi:hypothetical protein